MIQIKKHIPNTITLMNFLCGVLGIAATFADMPQAAFLLMLCASVFDFCDGLAARLIGAYSEVGKELDSLSDLVSFGVLPSIMLYHLLQGIAPGRWYVFVPLLLALFSALRLAKFNTDTRQGDSFLGLPTPACAIVCGSFAAWYGMGGYLSLASGTGVAFFVCAGAILLCALLVSEVPMFSFKLHRGEDLKAFFNWKRIAFLAALAASALFVLLEGHSWPLLFFAAFSSYIVLNLIPGK
ncbi:MAG: CDP-diacylglycerol--serine O-phosphatidyltransferase [Bacteroidales bacterium]|nr:CDP-diacylglycerol--serine O-phosphatidyltransferase [Bacteroidales bacterium]